MYVCACNVSGRDMFCRYLGEYTKAWGVLAAAFDGDLEVCVCVRARARVCRTFTSPIRFLTHTDQYLRQTGAVYSDQLVELHRNCRQYAPTVPVPYNAY